MQQIHVKRYAPSMPGFQGFIEPEDRGFVVFIANDGEATLWRRVQIVDLEGKTEHAYLDVEMPGSVIKGHPLFDLTKAEIPKPVDGIGPLDYTTGQYDEPDPGHADMWWARLNCRSIAGEGNTEHEAIKSLLNYVAQLCTAGCLDHTGAPMLASSTRRYQAVFGKGHPADEPNKPSRNETSTDSES